MVRRKPGWGQVRGKSLLLGLLLASHTCDTTNTHIRTDSMDCTISTTNKDKSYSNSKGCTVAVKPDLGPGVFSRHKSGLFLFTRPTIKYIKTKIVLTNTSFMSLTIKHPGCFVWFGVFCGASPGDPP